MDANPTSEEAQRDALLAQLLLKAENGNLVGHFCKFEVEFLVIGSTAVACYGCRDVTEVGDLDILFSPTLGNARKLLRALAAANFNNSATAESLARPGLLIPIKTWQYHADLLTPKKGVDFEQLSRDFLPVRFRQLSIPLISRPNLIRMKEQAAEDAEIVLSKHSRDLALLCAGRSAQ